MGYSIHPVRQAFDDYGAFPVAGPQGPKGDKGDTGMVLGGYPVQMKGEVDRIADLSDIVDPEQGDMYFVKEDGFYRFYHGEDWIVAIITTLPGKDGAAGQGLPAGGKTGDILIKKSDSDYDCEWVTYKDLWRAISEGNL